MTKILITGADGQIGWELRRSLADLGTIYPCTHQVLDIGNAAALQAKIQEFKPNILINAAAYTAVDQAESDAETAMRINGIAPGIMAEEAKKIGAIFIHYSTDYVFDGQAHTPYQENQTPHPLNVYGKSKLAGEEAVQAVGGMYFIFRTSWVYGKHGKNFLLNMLKLAQDQKKLTIVNDQLGAPTWSRSIAEATSQILAITQNQRHKEEWGMYHMVCEGYTSWYGFAKMIFQYEKLTNTCFHIPVVNPIPSDQYPQKAVRPKYSVLSTQKLKQEFGLVLPSWEEALKLCMESPL